MPAKRAKISDAEKIQEPEDTENSSLSSTRSKRVRQSIKMEPGPPEPKQSPSSDRQTRQKQKIDEAQYYEDLFDIICSYQDENQRYLANIFYVLPSKNDYPDYYELIKKPIDLNIIAKSILANQYKSLRQLDSDLTLMFDNAKRYNDPKSIIYKDACKLRKVLKDAVKELSDLQLRHKLYESKKNRDKKLKLIQEISEMTGEELTQPEGPGEESQIHEGSESDESESDGEVAETGGKQNQALISSMWSLFDYIKEFKYQGEQIIGPFLQLPPKRTYPDYYEEIKNPIAMNIIKKKLNKRLYKSFRDLVDDFDTMFKNAMSYNIEQSLLHQNAKRLLQAVKSKVKEIEGQKADIYQQKLNLISSPSTPNRTTKKSKVENKCKDKFAYLYNYINEFKFDDRELAPPFRHLPSKSDYPDYYNIIKKPIDMIKILSKITNQLYQTIEEMCADFCLMFENACVYNEPSSVLYKDALTLQRELFLKRDELLEEDDPPPPNPHRIVNSLIRQLFDSVSSYADSDGRLLADSFLPWYKSALDSSQAVLTLKQLKDSINTYTRMDLFQYHMFQLFDQIRLGMHPLSQTVLDINQMQRYFCLKRDDLCKNGEILFTNALTFKQVSADGPFSEIEALLVETKYRALETDIESAIGEPKKKTITIHQGSFYLIDQQLYCILKLNKTGSKLIGQRYFRPSESDFFKHVKCFDNEVFKTDLYQVFDVDNIESLTPCFVTSVKDFCQFEMEFDEDECNKTNNNVDIIQIDKKNVYVCDSMYSTVNGYVRRLSGKKWCPLQFIGASVHLNLKYNFVLKKRDHVIKLERKWIDLEYVNNLVEQIESGKETAKFDDMPRQCVQLESLASSAKLDDEAPETNDDNELVKSAKYFEQIVHMDKLFKMGDYVFIKHRLLHANQLDGGKKPLIFRIDRIWSINSTDFCLRGAVFLRAADLPHEPTRLFYRNEVFREISRDLTIGLSEVMDAPKCVVMSPKAYTTSRLTHISEENTFICESKYCMANKTFRKFAKCLPKFELSLKCLDDEIVFMSKEIALRKNISPLLVQLKIDYEQNSADYLKVFNLDEEEEWAEPIKDDDNSNHSLGEHEANKADAGVKKIRVKRVKKSGFQLFSREIRKAARDTQTSLSFTDMSKEVGARWKALSDKERQKYEERAAAENEKLQTVGHSQPCVQSNSQPNSLSNIHLPAQQVSASVPVLVPQVAASMPPIVHQSQQQSASQAIQMTEPVKVLDAQKQVMHRDAYIKYIANLKKNQQLNQTGAINNPMANISLVRNSDWFNAIDVNGSRLKENRMQNLPTNWIDNAKSNDLLQNLLSLRFYLLQDAVTIRKDLQNDQEQEQEEIMETNDQDDQPVSLTVL